MTRELSVSMYCMVCILQWTEYMFGFFSGVGGLACK